MGERMSDERLAEIGQLQITPESIADELLQALKAERQEVERLQKHINNQSHRHQQAMNRRLLLHREAERKLARLVELLSAERKALKDVERFGGYGFDEVYLDAKRDTDYMLEALTNTATGEGK